MTVKINGSHTKVREAMKEKRKDVNKEIRRLVKKRRTKQTLSVDEGNRLKNLEKSIPVYSTGKTLPAYYQGIIVNSKIVQSFMKKLKGLNYTIEINDGALEIRYSSSKDRQKGLLVMNDLTPYFEGMADIPVMEMK